MAKRPVSPTEGRFGFGYWRVFALGGLLGVAACGSATPSSSAHSVVVVSAPEPSVSSEPIAEPPRVPEFEEFLQSFLYEVRKDEPDLDRFVDADYGVFLLSNVFSVRLLAHYPDFKTLAEVANYREEIGGADLRCGENTARDFTRADGPLPRAVCEGADYEPATGCLWGASPSVQLREQAGLQLQDGLVSSDDGEDILRRAEEAEPLISHYIFSPISHLGFHFTKLSGAWVLFAVRSIIPC